MTCASCANHIERFLGRADGVTDASVPRATVHFDPAVIDRTRSWPPSRPRGTTWARDATAEDAGESAADEAERGAERQELLRTAIASLAIGLAMMAVMFWPGGTPWPMMDVNRWVIVPEFDQNPARFFNAGYQPHM
jgi:cation transport ATPase